MRLKWMAKRGLKSALVWSMAGSGLGALYRRSRYYKHGARILTYHKISDAPQNSFTVSFADFRTHAAYLADHRPVVSVADMARALNRGTPLEPGAVAISFDDGYKEEALEVADILTKHNLPATFYLVTGVLDSELELPDGPFMTWDDARSMDQAGFEIASHTVSHRSLGALEKQGEQGEELVRNELGHSFNRLEQELGHAPVGVSYPYGTMRDFSPGIAQIAKDVGYEYAVTAIHGLNQPGDDPYLLRRISMTNGDGAKTFRAILNGCLDPWVGVDMLGYKLQQGGGS